MKEYDDFYELFPNSEQQPFKDTPLKEIFHHKNSNSPIFQKPQFNLDDEQEVIDEELLKKTSELHEALRNIKLLKFQLIESRIMKKQNLTKCNLFQSQITISQKKKVMLAQQNEELQRQIHMVMQKINKQKENNQHSYERLSKIFGELAQDKIRYKDIVNNSELSSLLQDKQNISGIDNNRYISLEKITLHAENQSSHEMIELTKQEIISTKKKIAQVEAKKKELHTEYTQLLLTLKKVQSKIKSIKNDIGTYRETDNIKEAIHSEQIYYIGKFDSIISQDDKGSHQKKFITSLLGSNKNKKYTNTENKNKIVTKNTPTNILTCKKNKNL